MSTTIQVIRKGAVLKSATEVVFSPDDESETGNGYYLSQHAFTKNKSRTSRKLYRSFEAAKAAFDSGALPWEKWR